MQITSTDLAGQANFTRYHNQQCGHYESFFQRANHPTRPLAFWIRYTIFSPKDRPQDAIGELWAIYFNGETGEHVVVKKEVALHLCTFSTSEFFVDVDGAQLRSNQLFGAVDSNGNSMEWKLTYHSDEKPLFLLPTQLYTTKLPAAKSLVGAPLAVYNGDLTVNGERIDVANWVGSQNHNWGSKHTDLYAWGQVAGFDAQPGSFLEVATARLKIGPIWTPAMTLLLLRHQGKEYTLNCILQSLRAEGSFTYFTWHFTSETKDVGVEGTISATREAFVGLNYHNPPGGNKVCLNTKIAACNLRFRDKEAKTEEILSTSNRAAFEILTDDTHSGIAISA
jgi:tocopherol cyclase-like protein